MPFVITALAPGFAGTPTLQLAVDDARLMLPYLAFAGPVTVMMALMNAQARFALTAFSPLLFNIALIAVMAALLGWRQDAASAALIVAGTVGIAGLLHLSILLLRRGGSLATPLRVSFDADMRGFLRHAIPGMIASAAPQLLVVGGAIIASSPPSAVSWLYFANRLIELPLGIVGVAMGTVLVPELTRSLRGDDASAVAHAESRGLELAVGLALPATLGLIVLSEPVVRMLFEHGAFTAADTAATAQCADLAGARPARPCAGESAVAGVLRPPRYADAAVGDTEGICRRHRAGAGARPFVRRQRHRGRIALGAWSSALSLIRQGRRDLRIFDRCRGAPPAAAHRRGGARDGRSAVAGGAVAAAGDSAHGFAQALLLLPLIAAAIAVYGLLLSAVRRRSAGARRSTRSGKRRLPTCAADSLRGNGRRDTAEARQMAFVERVFSGVQPTGNLHLGNYLGAIVNFVKLQETHNCLYCVVDMHALTQPVEVWGGPAELARNTREVTAAFIASGIDPKKHIVFNQSQVHEHAELTWIFNCVARVGWLNRMTQFKDKAGKDREAASVGLYDYPVLMAADILVYRATHVPVGEDQKQHLELSRDIAQKFNNDFRQLDPPSRFH